MKKDMPIQAGTPNVITGVPEIKMTTGDFTKQWTDIFTKMAKDVYAIGNHFLEIDREIEENKEFNNINQKILEKRKLYSDEFENPEKIDLNNAEWRKQRDEALKKLREEEFQIIRYSKINNISKDKFADTSNTYYMEKSVKNNMVYGEFTRQNNLSRATNNIIDSIELIGQTDNESERVGLVNSINNSRNILMKYGVPEADINTNIMNNLKKSLAIASKNEIDNLFNSYDPDVAYIKAQELIGLNAQKYTALLGKVDGIKEEKAEEILKNYYNEQKDIFSGYVTGLRERRKYNQELQREREEKRLEKEIRSKKRTEDRIKQLVIDNDADGAIKLLNGGTPYTTAEKLSDDGMLNKIFGKNMNNFGNAKDGSVCKFLSSDEMNGLKRIIKEGKDNQMSNYEIAQNVIYPYVAKLAGGDERKKIALLKNIGYEGINGLGVNVLLNGENKPEYYQVSEDIQKGKGFELEDPDDLAGFTSWGDHPKNRYNGLLKELGGGTDAKKALDSIIKGYLINNDSPYTEDFKKNNHEVIVMAINDLLEDDDFVKYVKDNKENIEKIKITPIKYAESKVSAKNLNIKEIQFEATPTGAKEKDDFLLDDVDF